MTFSLAVESTDHVIIFVLQLYTALYARKVKSSATYIDCIIDFLLIERVIRPFVNVLRTVLLCVIIININNIHTYMYYN